jgi:hypothetical protein
MSAFRKGTLPRCGGYRRKESHVGKQYAQRAHRRGVKVRLQAHPLDSDLDLDQDTNVAQSTTHATTPAPCRVDDKDSAPQPSLSTGLRLNLRRQAFICLLFLLKKKKAPGWGYKYVCAFWRTTSIEGFSFSCWTT